METLRTASDRRNTMKGVIPKRLAEIRFCQMHETRSVQSSFKMEQTIMKCSILLFPRLKRTRIAAKASCNEFSFLRGWGNAINWKEFSEWSHTSHSKKKVQIAEELWG
jgi:hypothetical protein